MFSRCVPFQIHHELAKYHEMGRFGERGEDADMNAALFHEQCAAELGVKEAIVTLASIYLGQPHELLVNVCLEVSNSHRVTVAQKQGL
jgi:elongation factor 2 kinase